MMRSSTDPVRKSVGVRGDLARLLRAVDTRYTYEAAEALRRFDKPALVVWAAEDKLFPIEHGRRLAELLPQGGSRPSPEAARSSRRTSPAPRLDHPRLPERELALQRRRATIVRAGAG
jgi:pimeloyl-ACP methyl ester carboxylesterase